MKLLTKLTALTGVVVLALLGALAPAQSAEAVTPANPAQMSYIAIPHPDDEWQTWSLVENSSANYKVFVLFTQGEQTGYCSPKWTQNCADSRVSSWKTFMEKMSLKDPTVPGSFQSLGSKGPFPAKGYTLTRQDGGAAYPADLSADVYLDTANRGALVVFDLGDGDLTDQEVKWALETVRDNRAALGINSTLPNWNILGSYYNKKYPGCPVYDHADHLAVHRVLFANDMNMGYQSAATCYSDPDARRTQTTKDFSNSTAWGANGAFTASYGWLAPYKLNSTPFFSSQSFWMRFQ